MRSTSLSGRLVLNFLKTPSMHLASETATICLLFVQLTGAREKDWMQDMSKNILNCSTEARGLLILAGCRKWPHSCGTKCPQSLES